jgi:cell division protein FtsB
MKLKQTIWIIMGLDVAFPPVDLDCCRPSGSAIFRGRARTHQVGDFSRVKRYSSVQTDLIKSFVEQQTNNPGKLMRILLVSFTLLALHTVNGCVSQGTYDAVVQEGLMTRSELERMQEEHRVLVRQANDLEQMNADSVREAETVVAAVQQAKDDAEDERHAAEMRIARLKAKAIQAAKQHNALQYELNVAKENTGALQEMIDVYQRKMRDGAPTHPAQGNDPAVHKPFDPSTIPPLQDLPAPAAVEPPKPVAPPLHSPTAAATPASRTQDPVETGWLDSIKGWLVSLWRSVFS